MEFYIFCLKSGVVRIVRDHELAVVTEELRAMELKACAVVDGEQIHILICGAVEAVALAVHIDVNFSACGDLKAALVVQALYIVVEFEALLGVGDQEVQPFFTALSPSIT